MSPNLTPSIRQVGLQAWLDGQSWRHNGYGYDDYMIIMSKPFGQNEVSAKFNVSIRTVFYWEKQEKIRLASDNYKEDQKDGRPRIR